MQRSVGLGRVAVLDGGEGARRVLRAVHELGRSGRAAVGVALYAPRDRFAHFVRESDESVELTGSREEALRAARADTAWLGPAPLSERAAFAEACERAGVAHLGPSLAALRRLAAPNGLAELAAKLDLPLATTATADPAAHLVEVLVARDCLEHTRVLGVGDASLRRNGIAVLAESPSPALDATSQARLRQLAVAAAASAEWVGVCAVQFLVDPATHRAALRGLDAFAQSAPAVEALAGVDVVRLALRIAVGEPLGPDAEAHGHAFVARVQVQDPDTGPVADPGPVEILRMPSGLGVRADLTVTQGEAPSAPDGTLATVVARGETRDEALARMEQALDDGDVLLRHTGSSKAWLTALCARAEVRDGRAGVGFLPRLGASGEKLVKPHREAALLAAAVQAYHAQLDLERARFVAEARRGRPRVGPSAGRAVELLYRFHAYRLDVKQVAPHTYRVAPAGGAPVEVQIERLDMYERRLVWADRRYRILSVPDGSRLLVLVDGVAHPMVRDPSGLVTSPMPAVVVALPVAPGERVNKGDPVARVESMKVEVEVKAPETGVVRELLAAVNGQVDAGAPLLRIDPIEAGAAPVSAAEPLSFGPPAPPPADPRTRYLAALAELRQLLLGFDVGRAEAKRLSGTFAELAAAVPAGDAETLAAEEEALVAFADLQSLFSRARLGNASRPALEELWRYLHEPEARGAGLSPEFVDRLARALSHYGVTLDAPGRALELALLRTQKAHERVSEIMPPLLAVLDRRLGAPGGVPGFTDPGARDVLDRLATIGQERFPALADLAREIEYRRFDQPALERGRAEAYAQVEADLARLPASRGGEREAITSRLVECTQALATLLVSRMAAASPEVRGALVATVLRRYYRFRPLGPVVVDHSGDLAMASADYTYTGKTYRLVGCAGPWSRAAEVARAAAARIDGLTGPDHVVVELYLWEDVKAPGGDDAAGVLAGALAQAGFQRAIRRVSVAVAPAAHETRAPIDQHFSFGGGPDGFAEERQVRGVHFMLAERMQFGRLSEFELTRLPSVQDVYLYRAVARENPKDERLFAMAEVRDLSAVQDASGRVVQLPHVERMLHEALAGMRLFQARRAPTQRLEWNRVLLTVTPPFLLSHEEIRGLAQRLAPATAGLGLEMLLLTARMPDSASGELRETLIRVVTMGDDVSIKFDEPTERPLEPMAEYQQKVVQLRRRGLTHPFEIVRMLAPPKGVQSPLPPGEFQEYDLDESGQPVPVSRPPGRNTANIVLGVITNYTPRYPEGMKRVILLGDPGREMGSVAEPECRRIIAGLELAEKLGVPLEWFEVCAGAKISMTTGTENMDWVSRVLRKLIEFTQAGGEVNVVVMGITVGAQPYWNAEATMLMHTKGILVMAPGSCMVLTGKQALDYSGSVSAEDNEGIGGYDRIMGPNGQAQYQAASVGEACAIVMRHYEHTYRAPGERFPRRAPTADPRDRDVRLSPHGPEGGAGFTTVGDVFSLERNPERKKPFEIRHVMAACVDADHPTLERWRDMRGGDTAVVWDAHLGGWPVCLIGIQSRPLPRLEFVPADGPEYWSAGTLFPQSSKKIARAINSTSGSRPLVVLANLSGFDGSPESMRRLQLEYGAEIGRSVVNFKGPIVFCVVSRYHGGAFVVFAKTLREDIEIVAVEGARASVIGGAPAAAVVFAREVETRTRKDPRVVEAEAAAAKGGGAARARLAEIVAKIRSEKLGEVGDEFDRTHSVERALKVGSLDRIITPLELRPYLIDAVERGMDKIMKRG